MRNKRAKYVMKIITISESDRDEFVEALQKATDSLALENLEPEIDFSVNAICDTETQYNALILGVKYM